MPTGNTERTRLASMAVERGGPQRITYVGHATVLIELAGARILTDPMLRSRLLLVIRRQAPEPAPDLSRDLDAVLISHLHPDHLDFPSLHRVDRRTPIVAPTGSGRMLKRRGFGTVVELRPGEATEVGQVTVRATPAEHEGRRYKFGRPIEALGYDVDGGGKRVYFAGDTDLFDGMKELAGGLDVALLPIAGWGPHLHAGHLDPRRAAQAAAMMRPRVAVPIHWGTLLRAGLDRRRPALLTDPPREFEARMAELAPEVESRVVAPGESLALD
jgi:L-ascorbate metabolism protein UlaG (beta-lactamase superfamily)